MARSFRLMLFMVALLAGCGPAEETMYPVQGQIKFAGKPMTKGHLSFHPDAAKGNQSKHSPSGAIDAQGRYQVMTHPRDGAPPGWYIVTVTLSEPSDPSNPYAVPRSLIPDKFGKPDESGLSIELR